MSRTLHILDDDTEISLCRITELAIQTLKNDSWNYLSSIKDGTKELESITCDLCRYIYLNPVIKVSGLSPAVESGCDCTACRGFRGDSRRQKGYESVDWIDKLPPRYYTNKVNTKEKEMSNEIYKAVRAVYEKTEEAILVTEYSNVFGLGNNAVERSIMFLRANKASVLKRCKQLRQEEDEENAR